MAVFPCIRSRYTAFRMEAAVAVSVSASMIHVNGRSHSGCFPERISSRNTFDKDEFNSSAIEESAVAAIVKTIATRSPFRRLST